MRYVLFALGVLLLVAQFLLAETEPLGAGHQVQITHTASIPVLYCTSTNLYYTHTNPILQLYQTVTACDLHLHCTCTTPIPHLDCIFTVSLLQLYCFLNGPNDSWQKNNTKDCSSSKTILQVPFDPFFPFFHFNGQCTSNWSRPTLVTIYAIQYSSIVSCIW